MATVQVRPELEVTVHEAAPLKGRNWRWLPWAILALCASAFCTGVGSIRTASTVPSAWGLIGTASPVYTASIPLAALGFAIAIRQANMKAAILATILMVVVQRLFKSLCTDMPMYSWTYKHLGVVDYIQHAHSLARNIDIYNEWPGLFGLTAWFSDLTGVSAMTLGHWFPQLFHVLFTAMVYGVARAWGLAPLTAITATFLVATFNWVEQDYFSPQAMGMLFAAGVLALIGLSRDRPAGSWLIIILFAAANITHQLTPYWLLLMISFLAVSRKLKPWWIIFPLAVILFSQLVYNWGEVSQFVSKNLLSFRLSSFRSNIAELADRAARGQQVLSWGNKILSGLIWAGTAVALLVRWRKRQPFWAMAVLAFSGMLMLGGGSYGGEAIFRAYLYCLIGCCVVLAPSVVSVLQGNWLRSSAGMGVLLAASLVSLNSSTGNFYVSVMPKTQVEASMMLMEQAELPAYLTPVSPSWPERSSWRYVDYAQFYRGFDFPMVWATNLVGRHFNTDEDYQEFIKALNFRNDASTYLIFTDQMRMYTWYFGIYPWDALPNLEQRIANDKQRWDTFYVGQGVTIFRHKVNAIPVPDRSGP